jgi:hypothetical protein
VQLTVDSQQMSGGQELVIIDGQDDVARKHGNETASKERIPPEKGRLVA